MVSLWKIVIAALLLLLAFSVFAALTAWTATSGMG